MMKSITDYQLLVRSPMNYTGGKFKILNQILPLFPSDINCFVDLFAGGCNVAVNAKAKKIIANDNLTFLVELYGAFKKHGVSEVLDHVQGRIEMHSLSLTNVDGYNMMRELYNSERNPLDLFVLTAFSFNHQIRFNNNHQFNNPFGRERSSFNTAMEKNLINFVKKIQELDIEFSSTNFDKFSFDDVVPGDFVYCDPPYLITTGTYNDGKRGFTGWGEKEEQKLLAILDGLDTRGIKFALSNVLVHKGSVNLILNEWVKNDGYVINDIEKNYSNSSYHTTNRDKSSTREVLITNYPTGSTARPELFIDDPQLVPVQVPLFAFSNQGNA